MQALIPPGLYQQTVSKFEGTQLREEPGIPNVYYFWMNMTRAPFDDLKVREAVNYAVSSEALERIYAGSLKAAPARSSRKGSQATRPSTSTRTTWRRRRN